LGLLEWGQSVGYAAGFPQGLPGEKASRLPERESDGVTSGDQ